MNKIVLVFFKRLGAMSYPLNKPMYWQAYQELDVIMQSLGAKMYIVRHHSTYLGDLRFSQSWQFENGELIETGSIQGDVIYDKGYFYENFPFEELPHDKMLTHPELSKEFLDKWLIHKKFPQYSAQTKFVQSQEEYIQALECFDENVCVVKPVDGASGRGIFIDKRDNLRDLELDFPYLVQEFLDTSVGIPGIVDGIHDFRITILDGEIIMSCLRIPAKGSYLANVALGGSYRVVPIDKIPSRFSDIVSEVDAHYSHYNNRLYSIDFANTTKGIYIFEMNNSVGLFPHDGDTKIIHFQTKIAQKLLSMK